MTTEGIRTIDRTSPVPFYYQLSEILRNEIELGRWSPGTMLPSEGTLMEIFGVSRSVTRKALDLLEGDGQVYRVKGKGTIVAPPKSSYEAVGTAADWSIERSADAVLDRVVGIQRVAAGGHLGRLLGVSPRDELWEVTLTHAVEGAPASLSQLFLKMQVPFDRSSPPSFRAGGPDVVAQLSGMGVSIVESQVQIEATRATHFETGLLCIPEEAPIFLLSSLDFLARHEPIGFTRTVVRSDHFFFAVVIRRALDGGGPIRSIPGLGTKVTGPPPFRG